MGFMDPGNVVRFEIATADGQAVQDFYGALLGWSFAADPDSSVGAVACMRITAPGTPVPMGAIHEDADGPEERVSVCVVSADVAADRERLEKLGASVVVPETRAPDGTWSARMADPRGNVFSIVGDGPVREQDEPVAAGPVPGSYAWFEVGTTDSEATEGFYSAAFGWRFVFDDTAGGKRYHNVFTGNQWPSGGMYDLGADGVDYLMPDFLVTDVPATTARAVELGAKVEFGPDTNPDGLVYSRIVDPRGNRFGLFSMPTAGQVLA
ncbi:VOC family protein [Kitasatospora sp. NPDC059722]|uniref:VOC family protein n=1 Tax=Kitasatospora sp. NPDC059722 TaxID=3346925 RepID=UPI0036AD875A